MDIASADRNEPHWNCAFTLRRGWVRPCSSQTSFSIYRLIGCCWNCCKTSKHIQSKVPAKPKAENQSLPIFALPHTGKDLEWIQVSIIGDDKAFSRCWNHTASDLAQSKRVEQIKNQHCWDWLRLTLRIRLLDSVLCNYLQYSIDSSLKRSCLVVILFHSWQLL